MRAMKSSGYTILKRIKANIKSECIARVAGLGPVSAAILRASLVKAALAGKSDHFNICSTPTLKVSYSLYGSKFSNNPCLLTSGALDCVCYKL